MKILILSNMHPSKEHFFFGIFVKNFEDNIAKQGAKIDKVVIEGRGKNSIDKIKKYIIYLISSIKKILHSDYDLIYIHGSAHALLPISMIRPLIKKPYVINVHGSDVVDKSLKNNILFTINEVAIKKSSLIVYPSKAFRKSYYTKLKNPSTFVSPSGGVNTDLFKPVVTPKIGHAITFGFVSRIDEGKGWDTFLEALSLTRKQHQNLTIRALIAGSGEQESAMKELITALQLEDTVSYVGKTPQEELTKIYQALDIFIFPSKRESESLGLVGLEAMACGIPVIASNIGGIKDYLNEDSNGYLFEPGDHRDLANKISKFLSLSPEQKLSFSNNSIKTAQEYSSSRCAENLYTQLKRTKQEFYDATRN